MRCTRCGDAVRSQKLNCSVKWCCDNCGATGTSLVQDRTREIWLAERCKTPQIAKDFAKYDLPGNVASLAVEIYQDVIKGDTLKRGRRKAMMWKCAYQAYCNLNLPRDPVMLAKLFGVELPKMRNAQNDFIERVHYLDLKQKYPKLIITAADLLQEFLIFYNVEDPPYEDLKVVIDKIYASMALCNRFKSRDIAICTVFWYMNRIGMKVSSAQLIKDTLIAKATISKVVSFIQRLK